MALLLGMLMPSQKDIENMAVVVYDPEGSRLTANLEKIPNLNLIRAASADSVATEVEQKGVGGFAIPAGFDAAVDAGQQPELTVYLNNKKGGGMTSSFQSLLYDQAWRLSGDLPVKLNYYGMSTAGASQDTPQGNVNLGQYMLGMFLVIGLAMAGAFVVPTLVVEEKEKHTLEALLVSPATTAEVVAGKALVGLFYCLLEAGILILLNKGWAGNWPFTLAALLIGSLFVVALGLFMGSLFRTTHQVNTWSSIMMLVLMMPS
jgi:ABC-2 type transport system permease protein